jgi:3-deoxy-manno-octulosonate cytidylyltransferase (CMP-KDO synthetase)
MKFIGLIPARYASTRFPGKPLVLLGGMTVVERVYRRVSEVFDEVYVCTDDQRILDAVHSMDLEKYIMTCIQHYNTVLSILTALKILCAAPIHLCSPIAHGNHRSFLLFS